MPLKLVPRPKSPYWYIRGSIAGRRIEESAETATERSRKARAKREAELYREAVYGRRATATFSQAALSYLEAGGKKRFLAPIIKHFTTTPIAKIDQDVIERCAQKLYPNGSAATRNRQVFTPISAVLKHAGAPIILKRPRQPRGRDQWLTVEEAERLIVASCPHLRPLVEFLLLTGARAGEALWLDWRDVDLARRHVTFRDTKNGDDRGVPLHPRLVATLANLPHRDGYVFRRPDGLPYAEQRNIDDTSAGSRIKKAFAGACRRARLSGVSPHTCPPYLGLVALCAEPRPHRAYAARRLEDGGDGDALRARQRRRAPRRRSIACSLGKRGDGFRGG